MIGANIPLNFPYANPDTAASRSICAILISNEYFVFLRILNVLSRNSMAEILDVDRLVELFPGSLTQKLFN